MRHLNQLTLGRPISEADLTDDVVSLTICRRPGVDFHTFVENLAFLLLRLVGLLVLTIIDARCVPPAFVLMDWLDRHGGTRNVHTVQFASSEDCTGRLNLADRFFDDSVHVTVPWRYATGCCTVLHINQGLRAVDLRRVMRPPDIMFIEIGDVAAPQRFELVQAALRCGAPFVGFCGRHAPLWSELASHRGPFNVVGLSTSQRLLSEEDHEHITAGFGSANFPRLSFVGSFDIDEDEHTALLAVPCSISLQPRLIRDDDKLMQIFADRSNTRRSTGPCCAMFCYTAAAMRSLAGHAFADSLLQPNLVAAIQQFAMPVSGHIDWGLNAGDDDEIDELSLIPLTHNESRRLFTFEPLSWRLLSRFASSKYVRRLVTNRVAADAVQAKLAVMQDVPAARTRSKRKFAQ